MANSGDGTNAIETKREPISPAEMEKRGVRVAETNENNQVPIRKEINKINYSAQKKPNYKLPGKD